MGLAVKEEGAMADANGLVKTMKKAAVAAVEAGKPVNVFFGKVQSVKPLKIGVEQKMELGEAQLVLSRNVTDFEVMVTVEWDTEEALGTHSHKIKVVNEQNADGWNGNELNVEEVDLRHVHGIRGQKRIRIHNGLCVGDEVILIRQQEGQKFVVADRIGGRR